MSRYLIVNADDLGLSPGVNRGILEAHQRGILTSTTAMVNMPAVEAGICLLQQDAPQVGIDHRAACAAAGAGSFAGRSRRGLSVL